VPDRAAAIYLHARQICDLHALFPGPLSYGSFLVTVTSVLRTSVGQP
jgi:hypothetical protein